MPDYELHADYDRNGRLDATAAEYNRRIVMPGAILVPNLDADGRRLPATVAPGSRVVLDGRQPIAPATDDEQLTLRILVRRASAAAGTRFFLRPTGFPRIRLRFNDAQGRMLPRDLARDADLPVALPAAPGRLDLRLSTRTLPGSPIGHVTDINARFTLNTDEEATFSVQLISVDPAGQESQLDEAQFTIAPFVILDHSAAAVRTYIADVGANEPSLIEMEAAHRALGVPLVSVPTSVSYDTWLQDQFQHALIQGPDGWRQVILHMPRLRSDTYSGTTPVNLAQFVVSHFPSRNLGVFDDLWERSLQVFDTQRRQHRIAFAECIRLAAEMNRAFNQLARLIGQIGAVDATFSHAGAQSWTDAMRQLPLLVERLTRLVSGARDASEEWRAILDATRDDARARWTALASRIPYNAARGVASLPVGTGQIEVDARTADRLFVRIVQMRSSANYGGNIEASPPTDGAPLGKLVIGNVVISDAQGEERDFMDPDLLRLLFKQGKQPIAQVDTTWLHVGHVDEVMTFAPDRNHPAGGGFALLEASPALAMRLLRGARERFFAGLSAAERARYQDEPSGVALTRLTDLGSAPVTRLQRGKVWTHYHPPATGSDIPNIIEPPLIYQRLSQALNGGLSLTATSGGVNIHGIRYWPGEGPVRHYPAEITVLELLYAERDNQLASTNDFIARARMSTVADMLEAEFPQPRKFPLPVVFDRVPSVATWTDAPLAFETGAFTGNVVNMQVINGHLLVPRPYGPRMRPDDAAAVITDAMRACGVPDGVARRIDARFIRRHGLTTGVYWLERQAPITRPGGTPAPYSGATTIHPLFDGLETVEQVIAQFRDSFPGADEATLRRRIYDPNRRHFDARDRLLPGWRRLEIADGMIDLFEASVLAVADELGVQVHWIDSWYYHVRTGEIHCGTNVLRMPGRRSGLPNVWDVADQHYGPPPLEFEGMEITAPQPP